MEVLEAPRQVRNAVALLWGSLFLATVDVVASGTPAEDAFDWVMWTVYAIVIAVNAYLIFLVSRRKNWARVLLLVITVAVACAVLFWPPEIGTDPWWSILLGGVSTVADIVAMIWLFSGAGQAWFKSAKV